MALEGGEPGRRGSLGCPAGGHDTWPLGGAPIVDGHQSLQWEPISHGMLIRVNQLITGAKTIAWTCKEGWPIPHLLSKWMADCVACERSVGESAILQVVLRPVVFAQKKETFFFASDLL